MNPRTIAKLEARIHERAAYALEFEVRDPRMPLVTITRVELSKDLAHAKVFYSVLGPRSERSKAEHLLESAGGFIQRPRGQMQLSGAHQTDDSIAQVFAFQEQEDDEHHHHRRHHQRMDQ